MVKTLRLVSAPGHQQWIHRWYLTFKVAQVGVAATCPGRRVL
jgi:hypothetical protein